MPTYRIRFSENQKDLLVEAANFKVKDEVLELRANDDRRLVALIPLAKLLYITEEKGE